METRVEALPSRDQTCWKVGVPSRAHLILFFKPLLLGVVARGCAREPRRAQTLWPCLSGRLRTGRQTGMSWAFWLRYLEPDLSWPVSSDSAALGRRPPSYKLQALPSARVCLNHPTQVQDTLSEHTSMGEERAKVSRDSQSAQGARHKRVPATGL